MSQTVEENRPSSPNINFTTNQSAYLNFARILKAHWAEQETWNCAKFTFFLAFALNKQYLNFWCVCLLSEIYIHTTKVWHGSTICTICSIIFGISPRWLYWYSGIFPSTGLRTNKTKAPSVITVLYATCI